MMNRYYFELKVGEKAIMLSVEASHILEAKSKIMERLIFDLHEFNSANIKLIAIDFDV